MELWEVDYSQPYELRHCTTCDRDLDPECFRSKKKPICTQCAYPDLNWPTGTKHCGLCGKDKPYVAFHRDNYRSDGFREQDRHCVKLRNQRSEEHKKALSERTKLWTSINGHSKSNPDRPPKLQDVKRLGKPSTEKRYNLRYDPSTDLLPDFKTHLVMYYGSNCLRCHRPYDDDKHKLSHDHVLPVSMGGLHTYENSQPLCLSCNTSKSAKHIDYRTIPILTIEDLHAFLLQYSISYTISGDYLATGEKCFS